MEHPATATVYQLKIVPRNTGTLIWQRLLVWNDTTFARLHATLQVAMGWDDLSLHQFRIHGKAYGNPRSGGRRFAAVEPPASVVQAA
ncbi:MAG: hypothetical protein NVSMB65_12230 [Chloroflexota bacterium]